MSDDVYDVRLEIEGDDSFYLLMDFEMDREGLEALIPQVRGIELMNRKIMDEKGIKKQVNYRNPYFTDVSGVVEVVNLEPKPGFLED